MIFSFWGSFYSVGNNPKSILFFTIQSNFIVGIACLFFLFNFSGTKNKFFAVFSTIALFDILITGIVFNIFLLDFLKTPIHVIQHMVTPVLYLLLYCFYMLDTLKIKDTLFLLIHPLLYFGFGLTLNIIGGKYTGEGYNPYAIYPFFDVYNFPKTNIPLLAGMLVSGTAIAFLIVYVKNSIERRFNGTN
jgi:hypothetical protein